MYSPNATRKEISMLFEVMKVPEEGRSIAEIQGCRIQGDGTFNLDTSEKVS